MTATPRDRHPGAFADTAEACLPRGPRRGSPRRSPGGLFEVLAGLLTSSPPSTGPCFDKPKGVR